MLKLLCEILAVVSNYRFRNRGLLLIEKDDFGILVKFVVKAKRLDNMVLNQPKTLIFIAKIPDKTYPSDYRVKSSPENAIIRLIQDQIITDTCKVSVPVGLIEICEKLSIEDICANQN